MKKVLFLVLLVCLGLALTGSACLNTATTDVAALQGKICNPSDAAKAQASAAASFIQAAFAFAGPLTGHPELVAVPVATIFNTVAAGGCVLVTDLNSALAYFDDLVAQTQAKAVKTKAVMPPIPSVDAIRLWSVGK